MVTVTNSMIATNKGQRSFQSVAAFARPDNADVYAAGDNVSAQEAVAASLKFPGVGPAGFIDRVRICVDESDTMAFSLLLFDAEPTGFNDNAAIVLVDGDIEKLIGRWDFADAAKLLVEIGATWTTFRATDNAPGSTPYSTVGGSLFGLLMVTTGYTPLAEAKFNIRLQGRHDLIS